MQHRCGAELGRSSDLQTVLQHCSSCSAPKDNTYSKNNGIEGFFFSFRETGVSILTAVDDIQLMLDDHILKAQTMRGSPYVKPFEEEMQQWEEKLVSMQDILDAWLQVTII